MGNDVFANGREIACKVSGGKSICAFPDVCFTPPQTPATPPGVPIPYPNTGMASDTAAGSKNVKISGKEVMLKNKSYFKKSIGNESGCAAKKGFVTSTNMGKVYFNSWSMDVKFAGENVVRHFDLTTHNHMSFPGQTPPFPFQARAALAESTAKCKDEVDRAKKECTKRGKGKEWKRSADCPDTSEIERTKGQMLATKARLKKAKGKAATEAKAEYEGAKKKWNSEFDRFADTVDSNECQKALRCLLVPYDSDLCCTGQTGDHLVDASCFFNKGRGDEFDSKPLKGCEKYDTDKAPVMCVEGQNNTQATHGDMHTLKGHAAKKNRNKKGKIPYAKGRKQGTDAAGQVFTDSNCSPECIQAQLDKYHQDECKIGDDTPIRGSASGRTSEEAAKAVRQKRAGACATS